MTLTKRYKEARRVTIISAITNTLLAIFKIVIGILGHSHALIADGLHSFSDLITDGLVLIASKAGDRHPDHEYPYGYQRIETIAAILIALILIVVAGTIVYETLSDILDKTRSPAPDISVLIVALVSIVANEWLYRFTLKVGKRIHSNLLISNAWHNRSDAFTSLIVVVAVIGTLLGLHYLDAIGALIIALLIVKIGTKMIWNSIKELIDTGVDEKTLKAMVECIRAVHGVVEIHQLRTRLHGGNVFVDVHIIVDPFISVSEGHYIADHVNMSLVREFSTISDVTVHIDPEDDERYKPSTHLPSRAELHAKLKKTWEDLPGYEDIKKTNLHYLDGKLYMEVFMPQTVIKNMGNPSMLVERYRERAKSLPEIASVVIHFMPE